MNYYQILDVSQDADQMDIKKAYKRKSMELHPDRNPAPSARQAYDMVREAYNCLSNPSKRAAYDLSLTRPRNAYEDLESFFYRAKQSNEIKRAEKATSFSAKVTLEEAFKGCRRWVPGQGKYVNIPAGVIDGTTLKAGDLSIRVSLADHHKFRVEKNNLYAKVFIDAIQAMVGIDLIINHPNGEKLKTRILPGTQEGQKLRIAGKGLNSPSHGQGDLFIFLSYCYSRVDFS